MANHFVEVRILLLQQNFGLMLFVKKVRLKDEPFLFG